MTSLTAKVPTEFCSLIKDQQVLIMSCTAGTMSAIYDYLVFSYKLTSFLPRDAL